MKYLNTFYFLLTLFSINFLIAQEKPKLLWFDATANFERLSYPDSIKYYLEKTKELGFTDVVVDVKPITGEVLFPSHVAPQMNEWKGFIHDREFDFLNYFIEQSHKLKLKVHASLNVFVAGHNFYDRGLVYENRIDWQSINYTDSGLVPITKLKHKYSSMTNPADRNVQLHELEVIKELVRKYPELDGIILDRVRYDGIESDFSALSKKLFEQYIDEKIENYPEEIYKWSKDSLGSKIRIEGEYYKKWLEWRASVIYHFFEEARKEVKAINPKILFGDYTGSWYPLYYEVGVNWASKNYDPFKKYSWATENYKNYGYAELLDLYTTGCYFFEVTKDEVERINAETIKRGEAAMGQGKEYWYSVEGSAEIAKEVVMDAVDVIGGLYVEQYKDHPEQFQRAVEMCLKKTDGLMIFDIVHIINYGWWDVLHESLR
ncbi:MAG: family 10 glycosylhydrolase [Bacteroidetes bacterium]|nr:family 10 glycosylhydrolase [Bacteroidota bacterium]MBU2586150.1 family 10 glycosylhydrolase [Bacteroidota bacterium]